VPVAVLYHGELEWADSHCMPFEVPLRALYDRQIDCHVIPGDVFTETEYYRTEPGNPLRVNGQTYYALLVPETKILPEAIVAGLADLAARGLPLFFVNKRPAAIAETGEGLPEILMQIPVVSLEDLTDTIAGLGLPVPVIAPANDRIRILQIDGDTPVFFLVNEAAESWEGTIAFPSEEPCFLYDPWDNVPRPAAFRFASGYTWVTLTLEPLKSMSVVFGPCDNAQIPPVVCEGDALELTHWERSVCPGIEYPHFGDRTRVTVPEDLSGAMPEFSGFVRYERIIGRDRSVLEITDAAEAVEVFLNGQSLGIQIAPPFRYDLSAYLTDEENRLAIEIATTLERQAYPLLEDWGRATFRPPVCKTGLTGMVRLYRK
jgi:hypothetical protein